MNAAEIAAKLTKAGKMALTDARMNDHIGPRIICNRLYPPTISALERHGVIDVHARLTPLGLAVRSILQAKEPTDGNS